MEYTLRNSNEIICKHRKLRLQVPGKVFGESGQSVIKKKLNPKEIFTLIIVKWCDGAPYSYIMLIEV